MRRASAPGATGGALFEDVAEAAVVEPATTADEPEFDEAEILRESSG
jgi:hypothetical protein